MKARLGRMITCHMPADTGAGLHAMADTIGVARRWYHGDHYDICLAKPNAAIRECKRRDMIKLRSAYRARHTS
jgi:hypothetical protein